jgi:amino acid transporter
MRAPRVLTLLPASTLLGQVSPRTRTPIPSIIVVAAIGIGINLLSAGIAANVVSICSVAYYFVYALTVGGALYAYRKRTAGVARKQAVEPEERATALS